MPLESKFSRETLNRLKAWEIFHRVGSQQMAKTQLCSGPLNIPMPSISWTSTLVRFRQVLAEITTYPKKSSWWVDESSWFAHIHSTSFSLVLSLCPKAILNFASLHRGGGGNFLLQAVPEKEFSKLNEYERAFRLLEGKDWRFIV